MKTLLIALGLIAGGLHLVVDRVDHEKTIRAYFSGWEQKNWEAVASHLAEDFTFTSPAPDDNISIAQFKEKCWPQAAHIVKFEFPRFFEKAGETAAIIHVVTSDGRTIRNIEYFHFNSEGKIKSIEVFFGGTGQGFPTNTK